TRALPFCRKRQQLKLLSYNSSQRVSMITHNIRVLVKIPFTERIDLLDYKSLAPHYHAPEHITCGM
ncbi:MAG: hypothetical protein Q3961_03475, partial [Bifidobacteriaceae bacterium]|nr:hypothetical protein [Bifidobacteriaceae bacterium]